MSTHISVLPTDLWSAVTAQLESSELGNATTPRFLRLPHPRTGLPSLFVSYSLSQEGSVDGVKQGILEVQYVSPPNHRSWFMGDNQVVSDGRLLVMTPIDPIFLLLPLLKSLLLRDDTSTFRPADDMFDEIAKKVAQNALSGAKKDPALSVLEEDILHFLSSDYVLPALKRVCETKELVADISVFRYSREQTLETLREKVSRLRSPEVMNQSRTIVRGLAKDGLLDDGKEQLLELGHMKAACELLSQYLPPDLYAALLAGYDFTPLNTHLKGLQDADAAAIAAVEGNGHKASKKGKGSATEEKTDKKRKTTSHGVDQLKKANTTGMKKISSFFGAK